MIRKIKAFLGLCNHRWRTIASINMYDASFVAHGGEPFYYATRKQCVCEKCGKWKTFKIK